MTQTTTHGIVKWTNSDPASIVQASQAQGDSVDLALSKRERFDFVWENSAERSAQTGMVQGSRGYQVDTKSEYLYDNSAWRLALSYVEYSNTSQAITTGAHNAPSSLTMNMSNTTDSTFATFNSPYVNFANPGVYSVSWLVSAVAAGGGDWVGLYADAAYSASELLGIAGYIQGSTTVALPFYKTNSANTRIYPSVRSATATSFTSTMRIGRLG